MMEKIPLLLILSESRKADVPIQILAGLDLG
jgi:hypothetical protein